MGSEAETVFIEFLDAQRALVSGPWHGGQDETIALNLLGGLRTSLHHPSCLRIYDVGRAGPRWWATFEAVRGMDVLDWRAAQGRRISPRGAARIVADLAAILADVDTEWSHIARPEHVLIDERGVVRIAYFEAWQPGLCDPLIDIARPRSRWHDLLAPEIVLGVERSEATMVYALGVLLAFLATGDRPFGDPPFSGVRELLEAARRRDRLSTKMEIPEPLAEIVDAATEPKREDRVPTLAFLRALLEPHATDAATLAQGVRRYARASLGTFEDRLRFCARL